MQEKLKAVGLTPSIIKSLGLAIEGNEDGVEHGEDTVAWVEKISQELKYDKDWTPSWKDDHPEDEKVRDAILQALKEGLSMQPGEWFTMVDGSEKTFKFDEDGVAQVTLCTEEDGDITERVVKMKVNLELIKE